MQLGKVVGKVWSTFKDPTLEGERLLIVQPCNPEGEAVGREIVCCDATRAAGAGELIYWVRGREASFALGSDGVVADNTIVGIIDELHVDRTVKREE